MSLLPLLLVLSLQTPQTESLNLKRTFKDEEQVTYSVWADASELGMTDPITGKITLKTGKTNKEGKLEVTVNTSAFEHLPIEILDTLKTTADEHGALWDINMGNDLFPYVVLTAASFLPAVEMKPGVAQTISWKGATTKISGKISFKALEDKKVAVYSFDLKAEDESHPGGQGLAGESRFDVETGQLINSKFTYEVAAANIPFKITREAPKEKKAALRR